MCLSNSHNAAHLLSSPPPSNNPWLAWPTASKVEAAMGAAEVAEDKKDKEREEGAPRQDSGRQDSIAPIRRSAERSVGQQQFQSQWYHCILQQGEDVS